MNRKAISGSFYVGNKWLVQTHFILDNSPYSLEYKYNIAMNALQPNEPRAF